MERQNVFSSKMGDDRTRVEIKTKWRFSERKRKKAKLGLRLLLPRVLFVPPHLYPPRLIVLLWRLKKRSFFEDF